MPVPSSSSPASPDATAAYRRIASIASHVALAYGIGTALTSSSSSSSSAVRDVNRDAWAKVKLSDEVRRALRRGEPVVALESTIVAHGMPYPENLRTALEVEEVIRRCGATPATVAVVRGEPKVGLTRDELEDIARLGDRCAKASRRDLSHACGTGVTAATTVSATMVLARAAGVDVFVTGGVGGVHRDGEHTMDVSADLIELGRTNVAVICAGVKSILDIPKTLEVLETQGATVCAYGTDEFPAFFTRRSGCAAPARVDSPEEAAAVIKSGLDLNLANGSVFAVPIPIEHEALGEKIESATRRALDEVEQRGILGRDVTPYILKRVAELTGGESLKANIALVKNNAAVGARIAVHLARLNR